MTSIPTSGTFQYTPSGDQARRAALEQLRKKGIPFQADYRQDKVVITAKPTTAQTH